MILEIRWPGSDKSKITTVPSRGHRAYELADWSNFAVASAGAAAAVTGLLFGGGLYWVLGGVLAGFVGASLNAWVLLVEIQR